VGNGVPREERWVIVPASEIMAVLALATSLTDLGERLGRIIVGNTAGATPRPVRAADLKGVGAMTLLLRDALRPNLVQTLEGGPALLHAGPFGNIALADICLTEAGFGSDLGAEKFFDIKCRFGHLNPEVAVLVATVRALKLNGGANKKQLDTEDLGALERGLPNLAAHIENVRQFGVPVIVAVNRFGSDSDRELDMVADFAARQGVCVAPNDVYARGGAGGEELAREILAALERGGSHYHPLYDTALPIREKIDTIVRKVYGGEGADYSPKADRAIDYLESIGLGQTPICMAKTQYSFTVSASPSTRCVRRPAQDLSLRRPAIS